MKDIIESGKTALGIEFGSTRIKAVLIDEKGATLASGSHEWENQSENGIWTYSLDMIWERSAGCLCRPEGRCEEAVWREPEKVGSIGFPQ